MHAQIAIHVRERRWLRNLLAIACMLAFVVGSDSVLHATANSQEQNSVAQSVKTPSGQNAKRGEEIQQKKIDNPEADEGANLYRHAPNVRRVARFFGLPLELTSRLFEIVNFILLVIGISWLVVRILPKALRNRSTRLQAELLQARVATEDANRRLAEVEARLARLDGEIDAIRIQAERETVIEEQRLRAAMEQEKQSIMDAAALDIESATKNAESRLRNLTADLVIAHAKRRMTVTPEADRSLVDNFLSEIEDGDAHRSHGGVN